MKRTGILLMALCLSAVGCVELPIRMETKPPAREAAPVVRVEAPPVRPEQVNDADAPRVLNALRDELDRAANEPATSPPNP